MAVLRMIEGDNPGQIFELQGERMVFGRHPGCQVVLDNAAISRHHAQILDCHGSYFLEDLHSRNGTQLNSEPIEGRTELHEADEIRLCDFQFRFHEKTPPDDDSSSRVTAVVRTPSESERSLVDSGASDRSSIVTTLEASSSGGLRLNVNPEVKLRAVVEISHSLASVLDVDQVLSKILDGLFKIFPQADQGFILFKETNPDKMIVKATKSRRPEQDDSVPISMTIVRQAMETGEAILSANALDDSRFDASESLTNLRIRSVMCVPLVPKNGGALGVIQLATQEIRYQFSEDDLDLLASVASQSAFAIENANLHQAAMVRRELERELEFAMQVQLGFLPNERPKLACYEFFDYYEAAQRVGGDYFDYVTLPDGKIAITMADVAGKGVPAALLMARLYSSARFHLLTKQSAAEALTGLNGEIATSGLGHRFITCVMAILDPESHQVSVANAGHLPPLRRAANGEVEMLARDISGMPLGIVREQEFRDAQLTFEPGDTWILYTDGITEAMNPKKAIYGPQRLCEYLTDGPADLEDLVKGIVTNVEAFCRGRAQSDDMCLVGVQHRSETA